MSAIVWDEENRQFSVVDIAKKFGGDHKVGLINAATTAVGAGVGTAVARAKAKKAAEAKGLKPGTPEYKAYMRKQTLKGAGIGAAAGLGAGVVGQAGVAGFKGSKLPARYIKDKNGNDVLSHGSIGDRIKAGFKASKSQMKGSYVDPVTGVFKKRSN